MKVYCISGKAGHGKDTFAGILADKLRSQEQSVLIIHYADLLKWMCTKFFCWDGQKDEAGRHLLQYVGTNVIRAQRPDFWVKFVADTLTLFKDEWDFVLIPDCRFPNEIEYLKDNGFDVTHIRVTRNNYESGLSEEAQSHPSETALDDYPVNIVIRNNGSVQDLIDSIVVARKGECVNGITDQEKGRSNPAVL